MTHAEFNKLAQYVINRVCGLLDVKGEEYNSSSVSKDRLYNFKRRAELLKTTPGYVCLSDITKHLTSLLDLLGWGAPFNEEKVEEKCGDIITYCVLLEAILKDANKTKLKETK